MILYNRIGEKLKYQPRATLDGFWAEYGRKSQMNDKHGLFKGLSDDAGMAIIAKQNATLASVPNKIFSLTFY